MADYTGEEYELALRELLAHPLVRTTLSLNWHNLLDLSDLTTDVLSDVWFDQARAAATNGSSTTKEHDGS